MPFLAYAFYCCYGAGDVGSRCKKAAEGHAGYRNGSVSSLDDILQWIDNLLYVLAHRQIGPCAKHREEQKGRARGDCACCRMARPRLPHIAHRPSGVRRDATERSAVVLTLDHAV
eukprot:5130011-Pleurochrysis_carterae.AAC.1